MGITGVRPKPRRIMRLEVEADILLDLFKRLDGRRMVTLTGIPEDARVVGTAILSEYAKDRPNTIVLLLESSMFPEAETSQQYPDLRVEVNYSMMGDTNAAQESEGKRADQGT